MKQSTLEPSREIVAEASAWFIEFRTDNPNQASRDRFNAWLCSSPQHIQAYFEVAAAWSDLPDTDPEGRFDIEQMIRAAREASDLNIIELGHRFKPAKASQRLRSTRKWSAIAASLLATAIATGTYLYVQRDTYSTATGEQRSLTLADGSSVELNAQSRVRIRYSDRERHIDLLKGQALFRVAKNPGRPFIVDTGETQVRAVGTQFDVYRKATATIVTVVEGRVAVTAPAADTALPDSVQSVEPSAAERLKMKGDARAAAPVFLAAGEQLAVRRSQTTKLAHADIEAATAWTQKHLVFEDTPLAEVAEEFNRYNVRRLVIADSELRQVGVSGLYSSTDPTALIAFLAAQPGVLVTESASEIRISRK
jgi:transmembrane sensor